MMLLRIESPAPKPRRVSAIVIGLIISLSNTAAWPAPLLPTPPTSMLHADIEQVRAAVHRGGTMVGPRGGGVRWARPGWYRWPVGGAIAAGAAIGFLTAARAARAGAVPAPGMCWYNTDPSRTQGFWDYCPQ